jgi:prepilin-type N-terminal cleavage/methylation domain-containing protein
MLEFFSEKEKGFTLIELLVVIAIIGLLSSLALVALGPARMKARDARRESDFTQINNAMELCYNDTACNGGTGQYPETTDATNSITSIGNYLNPVPTDPSSGSGHYYVWIANSAASTTLAARQYYCAYVLLEGEGTTTYFCASNKGTIKLATSTVPNNSNCCGSSAWY